MHFGLVESRNNLLASHTAINIFTFSATSSPSALLDRTDKTKLNMSVSGRVAYVRGVTSASREIPNQPTSQKHPWMMFVNIFFFFHSGTENREGRSVFVDAWCLETVCTSRTFPK